MRPDDTQVEVINQIDSEALPAEFIQAALAELKGRSEGGGPIGSFPLTQLKVTLLEGEMNLEQSNETAFTIAAADAFEEALKSADGLVTLGITPFHVAKR